MALALANALKPWSPWMPPPMQSLDWHNSTRQETQSKRVPGLRRGQVQNGGRVQIGERARVSCKSQSSDKSLCQHSLCAPASGPLSESNHCSSPHQFYSPRLQGRVLLLLPSAIICKAYEDSWRTEEAGLRILTSHAQMLAQSCRGVIAHGQQSN